MNKLVFFYFYLFLFINSSFANNFNTIASINDKIITQYDLENYSKIIQIYLKNKQEITVNIKKEILNNLIEEILKAEAIKNENIIFDNEEFNYYLESLKDKENIDENIKKFGVDKNIYLNILKNNFLWSKLIETQIRPRINVTTSEINDSLEYLTDKPIRTRYEISQITIYKKYNNNPKTIIDKLYSDIKEKNNFESIAEKFSEDNKKSRGYIGWVDEMDIDNKINQEIKNLAIGNISKPMYFGDSNTGYYMIIKLINKKQERIAKNDDIARVQYFIYNQKLNLEIKNYIDILYNNALIETY